MSSNRKSGSVVVRNTSNPRRAQQGQAQRSRRRPSGVGTAVPASLPLLRTSERSTFKRCRWKWWLEFDEMVKPKVDVPPLRFGSLIHEALAAYYIPGVKRGTLPAKTFEMLYAKDLVDASGKTRNYSAPEIDQIWSEHRDMGIDMLEMYVERYGKDEEWEVLVTEFPFQTIVPHPRDGVTPWFYYVGTLDGVWRNRRTKRKVINDFKTTKAINLKYLQMDDQATAYWTWGVDALMRAGLLAPNGSEKLDGMLFNFLRKAKRDDRPQDETGQYCNKPVKQDYLDFFVGRRGHKSFDPKWKVSEMAEYAKHHGAIVLGAPSKVQPSPYHARVPIYRDWYERDSARLRVIEEFKDIEAVRAGKIAHYKNPSQFTCGGCWAFDICELHEIGQDWLELREMTTSTWEPYSQHEIKEGR